MNRLLSLVVAATLLTPSDAQSEGTAAAEEARCQLRSLFIAEKSYLNEKDRYETSLAEVGFVPLPCPDGSRAEPYNESSAGCRLTYRVTRAGTNPADFEARASGEGRTFVVGADGQITENGRQVPEVDCGAWHQRADPLWRVHSTLSEHECTSVSYPDGHPCNDALDELSEMAHAGVGVAVMEYERHPTAKQRAGGGALKPSPRYAALCAANQDARARAAVQLDRAGELLGAVLSAGCAPEGIREGAALLLARLDRHCPGAACLPLLSMARAVGAQGVDASIKANVGGVASALLEPDPADIAALPSCWATRTGPRERCRSS